jgi:cell division protein ZapE
VTREKLLRIFLQYEGEDALYPQTLSAAGRPLSAQAAGASLLWASFGELCVARRSHLDYLDLTERWQALIVDQLDTHSLATPHTLQRFVWLVDIFYDRKRALFIASDQPVATALNGLEGAHDLSRTLSRLAEMQSRAYLNPPEGVAVSSEATACSSYK